MLYSTGQSSDGYAPIPDSAGDPPDPRGWPSCMALFPLESGDSLLLLASFVNPAADLATALVVGKLLTSEVEEDYHVSTEGMLRVTVIEEADRPDVIRQLRDHDVFDDPSVTVEWPEAQADS